VLVLAIDTSSPAVTAGLVSLDGGRVTVLATRAPLAARGHGELLAPAIDECLRDAGAGPRDVAAVVAGTGPGPYTGLRVGLVTAAAFAHAVGVPTYGVCSLDAIAVRARDEDALLVATDARRREVYWARYTAGERTDGPQVARPADVPLEGLTALAGAGAELYADVWPAGLARLPHRYPDAEALAALAAERVEGGAAGEPLTPLYLRRPDAVVPGAPKAVTR
jgi:tRNA threonylcarbamoyl adenosine modification protein YeaZ